jgi:uncharacterized protein (DUF1800 family)
MDTRAPEEATGMDETRPGDEDSQVTRVVDGMKKSAKACLSGKTSRRKMLLGGGAAMAALFGTHAYSKPTQRSDSRSLAEPQDRASAHPRGAPILADCPQPPGDPPSEIKLLHKGTLGFTQAELARVQSMGYDNWLDEQLNPASMPEWATFEFDLTTIQHPVHGYGPYVTLPLPPGGIPGGLDLCDNNQFTTTDVRRELVRACLIRAIYSPAQLFERAVMFWTDHVNTHHRADYLERLKTFEDRLAIRAHALGNFSDLLMASAKSPAMLVYLNGRENTKNSVNENYAREIMELHTLGGGNCYDEDTIKILARMLTGWNVDPSGAGECGVLYPWNNNRHNDDPKTLIFPCDGSPVQFDIPGGLGEFEIDEVIDILTNPSKMGLLTAEYVGRKLCKFFSGYEPPQELVDAVVAAYVAHFTGDNIKEMIRVILSQEWIHCGTLKVKRPIHLLASALRACEGSVSDPGAEDQGGRMVGEFLQPGGHVPYGWPTPDGYPDTAEYWSALLPRWNFGASLSATEYSGANLNAFVASLAGYTTAADTIDALDQIMFGGCMSTDDHATILGYINSLGTFDETAKRTMIGMAVSFGSRCMKRPRVGEYERLRL